jgi:hypothetical protein
MSIVDVDTDYAVDEKGSGRPSYATEANDLFLYHVHLENNIGRWIIDSELFGHGAISFIDSWAITPDTILHVNDNKQSTHWMSTTIPGHPHQLDISIYIKCMSDDEPIYFETFDRHGFHLNGFYTKRLMLDREGEIHYIYTKIKENWKESSLLLHHFNDKWIIGHNFYSDQGVAFVVDNAGDPKNLKSRDWKLLQISSDHDDNGDPVWEWTSFKADVIFRETEETIYEALHNFRRISYESNPNWEEKTATLRNGVIMPRLGLSLGDFDEEYLKPIVSSAAGAGIYLESFQLICIDCNYIYVL